MSLPHRGIPPSSPALTMTTSTPNVASPAPGTLSLLRSSSDDTPHHKRRRFLSDQDLPSSLSSPSSSSTSAASSSLNLFHELRNLRQFGVLTDITLKSGKSEVQAHRCVLAASSDYFRACLTSSMKECQSNCVIELPLLDEESLYRITDFIYGEEVLIDSENIISLLDSADQLNLDLLKLKCCKYLSTTLTPLTCFNVCSLADRYNCLELCQEINNFICRNFEDAAIHSEEFVTLSFEELLKYLSSDALSVRNESKVFQAALKWIRHSQETRAQYLLDLFHTIRLKFMTVQDIAQFIHPVIAGTSSGDAGGELFQSPQGYRCLLQVMNAYRWHALPATDAEKILPDGHVDTPRNYARKQAKRNRLVVLGGDDGYDDHSPFNSVFILDEILNEWVPCPSFSQARSVPGSVAVKDRICIIGGYDGARASSLMDIFDIPTSSWGIGLPLKQRRCSCVCVSYRDHVYCIGGVCGPQALNSVERISINDLCDATDLSSTSGWTECPSLQENRSACGAAVLYQNNHEIILVCGGITTGGDTVATTEKFSDSAQAWVATAPMTSPRRSFGMCVYEGKAYAIGGNDGTRDLNTVEVYDPETNTWSLAKPMIHQRMFCSAALVGDKIVVIGGVNSGATLDCGEVYDPVANEWTLLEPPLPSQMCGCGVVCAEDVPYAFFLKLEAVPEEIQDSNEEKVA